MTLPTKPQNQSKHKMDKSQNDTKKSTGTKSNTKAGPKATMQSGSMTTEPDLNESQNSFLETSQNIDNIMEMVKTMKEKEQPFISNPSPSSTLSHLSIRSLNTHVTINSDKPITS